MFNARKSVDAALARERMNGGSRTEREVLRAVLSEVEHCEANGCQSGDLPAWREEAEKRLRRE